ncbi:MAG TPA: response regulator [Flavipsychrobacter sp.]|nr:response regulator [Flavipsychrobacter sp.]
MNDSVQEKDILLAEDDKDDVEIFEMALNTLDIPHVLRNAVNGDVLFVLLKEKIPYILFLDIHMPCKDGIACISEIRRNREYDSMPVIMYTSLLTEKHVEESYRNGANMFLEKTNTFDELVGKLKKIFDINWTEYLHFPPRNNYILS